MIVDIFHHPTVAARGMRCACNQWHQGRPSARACLVSPWVALLCSAMIHAMPFLPPCSSPPMLAIPNFPTALLKTLCRRTYSCARSDSDIDAGGAREEALSCLPGSLMQVSTRVTWDQLLWNIRTRQGLPMRLILQFSAAASLSLCISFGTLSRIVLALRPPLACAG